MTRACSDGRRCSALLTDLYQLTMACGYWKSGKLDTQAVFHLLFRTAPFGSGFTVACGLADAIEYLRTFRFVEDEIEYLAGLRGNDGEPLFPREFLDYLDAPQWKCDLDAIPEGTVVFPNEPLLRVQGPLLQCQLVETALLNLINFHTLIATKAARVCLAAGGDPVLEFGLRRAQGSDGALAASRAAYIGGCAATSDVLAARAFGIPVRGTHAHSWVMSFADEEASFRAYADAMPNNCVFLVDTYSTRAGIEHAIREGQRLREKGYHLGGIRLDSGDLAYWSIEARCMLDNAGLHEAAIMASNDLDEHLIASLKQQGARIDVWAVGTKLVTAFDQPALSGVYKLAAVRVANESWQHKIKLSEQAAKTSIPGIQQVRRFRKDGLLIADMIYNLDDPSDRGADLIIDPADLLRRKHIPRDAECEDLLVPVFRTGELVYDQPYIEQIRARLQTQLASLHNTQKRFLNPHTYPVGLSPALHSLRARLIAEARGEEIRL